MSLGVPSLRESLDRLHGAYQRETQTDPIHFPLLYSNPADREVVALISAMYAFGNVKMIFNTLKNILEFLGERPYQKILDLKKTDLGKFKFAKHRWITPQDTRSFLNLVAVTLNDHGSLENSFLRFYKPNDSTLESALMDWMDWLQEGMVRIQKKPLTLGQKFLLSSPRKKSTSKRLLMFCRWVIRDEDPDLGLWKKISKSKLLIPLDTHLFRFSRYLGFTKQKQSTWKTVVEVTAHFQKICPEDPIRYDFSLARLGIMSHCIHKADAKHCSPCLIRNHCRLAKKRFV